jgi:hypothetical protein
LETADRQNKAIHGKISDFKVRRGTVGLGGACRADWSVLFFRLFRPVSRL